MYLTLKKYVLALFLLAVSQWLRAQADVVEREYFPNARAKNASIAAARYAEEGYYYAKFNTIVSTLDSSRRFADTSLFFIGRALMLADTSLLYAPAVNYPAISFLESGVRKTEAADSVIRGYYGAVDVAVHHKYSTDATLHLSNAVMEFYNASLLLHGEREASPSEKQRYEVLPYADEVVRLEADETAFQNAANRIEEEIDVLSTTSVLLDAKIAATSSAALRAKYQDQYISIARELAYSKESLIRTSAQLQTIRQLLADKYLTDVAEVDPPQHISKFETQSKKSEIAMNEVVPDGLVYKIQLGYYSPEVDQDNFYGLFPISGETVSKDLARYYAGVFFSYADASEGANYVREHAIPNAFIVPFYNGNKISASWAVELERRRSLK